MEHILSYIPYVSHGEYYGWWLFILLVVFVPWLLIQMPRIGAAGKQSAARRRFVMARAWLILSIFVGFIVSDRFLPAIESIRLTVTPELGAKVERHLPWERGFPADTRSGLSLHNGSECKLVLWKYCRSSRPGAAFELQGHTIAPGQTVRLDTMPREIFTDFPKIGHNLAFPDRWYLIPDTLLRRAHFYRRPYERYMIVADSVTPHDAVEIKSIVH